LMMTSWIVASRSPHSHSMPSSLAVEEV